MQVMKWKKGNIPIIEMLNILPRQVTVNYKDFTPIHVLNNYVKNPVLCLRVLKKDTIRTWSKESGDGKLFSMTCIDRDSDLIKATIFNVGVDKFYEMISEGEVYTFRRAMVKSSNARFQTFACEF